MFSYYVQCYQTELIIDIAASGASSDCWKGLEIYQWLFLDTNLVIF